MWVLDSLLGKATVGSVVASIPTYREMENKVMIRIALVALATTLLFGCDSRECERARLDAYKAYQTLHQASIQRKLAGVDTDNWAVMENKVDLLQSAFATQQVTWRSADNAKQEVATKLESISTDNDVNLDIFKRSAAEAFQAQEAFAQQCR